MEKIIKKKIVRRKIGRPERKDGGKVFVNGRVEPRLYKKAIRKFKTNGGIYKAMIEALIKANGWKL